MFLKRIAISGFKSFGDKVDFDFGPGITCIVGPNGCGKSNVVDAFKWVLGEQSARSLRGRQMSDMIFNGSSSRRSSSVAQVDLLFDNTDRALAIDQDEVTVSRKLYRSGESEYQLNHDAARLKDVRELFMDTGIGVEAYSVVEQGRVDSLLKSSPADRRTIFEEAAGISKYKARRREAERKLERTQQNLLRVEDVVQELEKRLRSVKLQAGKARTYREHEARLNELRSSFAMAEFHRYTQATARLTREVAQRTDLVTGIKTDIDRHEAEEAELTSRVDRLAEEINVADSDFVQAKSELLAQEERIEASTRRAEEQRVALERAKERRAADSRRLEQAHGELDSVQESAVALQKQTHELNAQIDELMDRDRRLARDLTQAQAVLEDEKAGIIELLRKSAQLHNEIIRLNTHRESLVGQKGRLSERDAQLSSELEASLGQKAELDRRTAQLDELIAEETRRLDEKKAEAARVNAVRQRLVDELAEARQVRSGLRSRRELLEDLQRRMEGVGTAVRSLLDRQKLADAPASLATLAGLVADVFETDVAHARVIEAALGSAAEALLITDSSTFLSDQETLAGLTGRLTVVCLDRLRPPVHHRDFSEAPGFVARAVDLVRVAERHEALARHLLGKTVVMADLDAAVAAASGDHAGYRFVTLKGEIVDSDGRVSVGPPSMAVGLISRKSELRDIESHSAELEERINSLGDQLNRTEAEAGHLEGVQQELRTGIYEASTAKVEANAARQSIAETVQRLTKEQPLIAQEVAMIEHQISEVHQRSKSEGRSLETIEAENRDRELRVDNHQTRIDEIVTARQGVQESLTQARVAAGQLTEKRAAAAETINAIRRTIHEAESSVANAVHDIEQCEARITDAEESIVQGRQKLRSQAERITQLEARCTELRRKREEHRRTAEALVDAIRSARTRLAAAEEELQTHKMSLTENNVRRDDLIARVRDELGIDLAERYDEYQHEDQDWEAVEREIAELRGKMERLGNVNLGAIDELAELEERHQFLTSQRDDLNTARRQLEQLIERLNAESKERFRASFIEIRDNFRTLFRKLFGGGRADVVLEDSEDVLECGIEIMAQPPGKELQAISLMSGGEKSMTAIALLMSIFMTRPAPFAIMDEVDAALDEANNERFNRIVQEFVSKSQFLVITHSKWTMNIADRLYGVTMQEPGVSTRVSVELSGANVA